MLDLENPGGGVYHADALFKWENGFFFDRNPVCFS
jgi:hypothetical protein